MLSDLLQKLKFFFVRIAAPSAVKSVSHLFPRRKKTLLVIKNDGIGDYLLFRNYLLFLKNSKQYDNYQIYVLANRSGQDLAEHLDSDAAAGFFWYADNLFLKWGLIKLLWNLQILRPESVFYTNYSRKFETDWLVKQIVAKHKIGIDGDNTNQQSGLKSRSDKLYTQLLVTPHSPLHEFDRNKQICEALTGEQCTLVKPTIEKQKLSINQHNSVVMFIGGSSAEKRWPLENFRRLSEIIISNLAADIIIAGGKDDVLDSNQIINNSSSPKISSQVGLLSLVQLCELIGGASLVISNDTVAIHLAVALDIPVVCVAKGDLYGRFIPYPKHIYANQHTVFPNKFSPNNNSFYSWSPNNINEIAIEEVYHAVESILANHPININ